MRKSFEIIVCLLFLSTSNLYSKKTSIYHIGWIDFNKNGKMDLFEDPNQPIEKRVADLLSQMTLDEKTCQTATLYGYGRVLKDQLPTAEWKNEIWKDGIANIDEHLNGVKSHTVFISDKYTYPPSNHAEAINTVQKWFVEETRLGIPVDFSNEGIHGLAHDRATSLPSPIAIGSTWNKGLVYKAGIIVGREAKILGYTNVYTPILDVSRDQRWGRVVETYGEDPFLIAELGINMVKGVQSQGVASTIKHFAVYGVPKGGRDGNTRTDAHVAPREMLQMHLYPFRRVIQEAHPMGVMSSYNDWDGEPITGSYYFLMELLRQQFGFTGYVVSDSEAVEFLYSKHRVVDTYKEAVRQAFEAGLNVRTNFSEPKTFILPLRELINEGKVSMKTLDERVADVLRVKFQLGLFDAPYVKDPKKANKILDSKNTNDFVLDMARQSIVLLKNENRTLPLDLKKIRNILVTGPLANETSFIISRYGPSYLDMISVLEGVKKYVGSAANVNYAKGCNVTDATWPESEIFPTELTVEEKAQIDSAVLKAKQSDVIIAVMGEDKGMVGETKSRTCLDLPSRQEKLVQALQATGIPVIVVLVNGHPLTINWINRYVNSLLETWFSNAKFGQAVAETLFGDNNPGGKLTMTFPKTVGQIEFNFPYKPSSQADQPKSDANGFGYSQINGALYPFGYGLSYTTFAFSNLQVSPEKQNNQGEIRVSVDVKNTGTRKGDEVVQLYLKDLVSSVITYDYQLRGFERVSLRPDEAKTVRFTLKPDDLALLDKNMKWIVEPGKFEVMIGNSSVNIKLKKEFEIVN